MNYGKNQLMGNVSVAALKRIHFGISYFNNVNVGSGKNKLIKNASVAALLINRSIDIMGNALTYMTCLI